MLYCNIMIIQRGDFVARFKIDRNGTTEKTKEELSFDFLKRHTQYLQ